MCLKWRQLEDGVCPSCEREPYGWCQHTSCEELLWKPGVDYCKEHQHQHPIQCGRETP